MDKTIVSLASLSGALVVGLGAFGAHGLEELLVANDRVDTFETAVQYHMFHTIALLFLGIAPIKKRRLVSILIFAGILIFSGSLYTLSITDMTWLGAITPLGGVGFIVGWLILLVEVLRN